MLPSGTRGQPIRPEVTDDTVFPQELLDAALARVGRLEAALAAQGGVLHDVNNLLTVLSGNLFLVTESVREDGPLFARCRDARHAADRASALIRELLTFEHDRDVAPAVICPANYLAAIEALLRRAVGSRHTLTIGSVKDPWCVRVSSAQLESAVINLVLNAHQALGSVGRIDIRIDNVTVTHTTADEDGLPCGEFVRIRVSDDGPGVPPAILARLDGRAVGDGDTPESRGMGLTMVGRFAAQANGALRVASAPREGTSANLWLPRCIQDADMTASMTTPLSTLPSGSEKVLVAMADGEVGRTVKRLLDALGYSVVTAGDRKQALETARVQRDVVLLVCERSPGGAESDTRWLTRLRSINPSIRQIAILGHGDDCGRVAPDADVCLRRPVAVAALAKAVRDAIEDPA